MSAHSENSPRITLFGLDFCAVDFAGALALLEQAARAPAPGAQVVFTPNVDHIVRLDQNPAWKAAYASADYLFADGMPIVWLSRLMGRRLPARVTGADLFVHLCQLAARHQWQIAVIGGQPGQEADLRQRFNDVWPGLQVHLLSPPMGFDPEGELADQYVAELRELAPAIVFVCLGLPRQERWALRAAPRLPGGIVLGVGAAMEFALGLKRRAPGWVQRLGAEWLWRLLSDPRHLWRRYLVDDRRFVGLAWQEWRQSKRNPPAPER